MTDLRLLMVPAHRLAAAVVLLATGLLSGCQSCAERCAGKVPVGIAIVRLGEVVEALPDYQARLDAALDRKRALESSGRPPSELFSELEQVHLDLINGLVRDAISASTNIARKQGFRILFSVPDSFPSSPAEKVARPEGIIMADGLPDLTPLVIESLRK
ncbi:MAG: hypothetical protein IT452_20740 [Planctomycetia bacterium]|nr:hypothetical protein [Planctomycetia bacterium]